jgi:hypothetical protein
MMSSINLIPEGKLDDLILEIVENVLTEIFGVASTRRMLQTMKKRYHLEVQEIPQEPGIFSHALQNILGKNHTVIEDLILENLCLKLELKLKVKKDYTFSDYIMDLRFESL